MVFVLELLAPLQMILEVVGMLVAMKIKMVVVLLIITLMVKIIYDFLNLVVNTSNYLSFEIFSKQT